MTAKKKILIRIGSLRHGGAEKVLVTFLKNLPKHQYDIDLLLNLYSGKYLPEVPSWINVLYLNKGEMITTNRLQDLPKKAYRVIYQKILKKYPRLLYSTILKNKKYDIEFAAIHGFRDEILNSPIKNSKKMVWIHNDLRKTQFHNYTDDEIIKFFGFDKILVISEQIQQDFENLAKNENEKSKIVRIYNPIDTEEIIVKSQESRTKNREPRVENREPRVENQESRTESQESRIENREPTTEKQQTTNDKRQTINDKRHATNDKRQTINDKRQTINDKRQPITNNQNPMFVSVGTVFPQKGFDRLLRVHRRLLDEGFQHRVRIIGDGYDFENIKNLKTELGVDDTAEMLGFTDNPYPYFNTADFYILSSRYEGYPTVLFEALTLKKNIIATEVSGVREMLENGKLGLIVDNSEEGIYDGMKKALTNPEVFSQYQENLKDYHMPFNLKNSVKSITKIIDEI